MFVLIAQRGRLTRATQQQASPRGCICSQEPALPAPAAAGQGLPLPKFEGPQPFMARCGQYTDFFLVTQYIWFKRPQIPRFKGGGDYDLGAPSPEYSNPTPHSALLPACSAPRQSFPTSTPQESLTTYPPSPDLLQWRTRREHGVRHARTTDVGAKGHHAPLLFRLMP